MKTDTLQDSLDKYRAKIGAGGRNRAAAYELALASGRNYKPGDQVSYYVKATPKKVAAYEAAKLRQRLRPAKPRRECRLLRREARRAGEEVQRHHDGESEVRPAGKPGSVIK